MSAAYAMESPAIEGGTAPLDLLGFGSPIKEDRNLLSLNLWPDLRKPVQSVFYGVFPTRSVLYGTMPTSYKRSGVASARSAGLPLWPGFVGKDINAVETPVEIRPIEVDPADTWPIGLEIATVRIRNRAIEARFSLAFRRACGEHFEDGMNSQFTADLNELVKLSGADAKNILIRMLDQNVGSPGVWAEAMRWFGNAHDLLPISDAVALEAVMPFKRELCTWV